MERKALYAGSFDPVTNGHLNIIERAAAMYDSLTVAVVVNPQKTGFFSIDERVRIIEEVTEHRRKRHAMGVHRRHLPGNQGRQVANIPRIAEEIRALYICLRPSWSRRSGKETMARV